MFLSHICHYNFKYNKNPFVYSTLHNIVPFFPQMRPEKKQVHIELEDEEKLIVALLQTNQNKMDLGVLKVKAELSGKKWDAAMKGLSKHGLVKVSVDGESKTIEYLG